MSTRYLCDGDGAEHEAAFQLFAIDLVGSVTFPGVIHVCALHAVLGLVARLDEKDDTIKEVRLYRLPR